MAHLFATAGSRLYIAGPMAFNDTNLVLGDFPDAGDSPDPWTEIKGTTNLGSAGDSSSLIDATHIDSSRVRKMKGVRNAGSMTVVTSLDYADAGQLALIAAEATKESYAFRLVFNDAPVGGTPSERYFVAFVMSASEQYDEANSVMSLNSTLEIDSNIVRVAAAD